MRTPVRICSNAPRFAAPGGIIRNIACIAVVLTLTIGTARSLRAQDPRIGSWKLVSASSSLEPANRLSVTPVGGSSQAVASESSKPPRGSVHVVISGETHTDFTAKPDGHDSAVAGNPAFNQIELHRIDKKRTEIEEKKDGSLVATVRAQLSSDGQELTVTTVSAGRPDRIAVWTRSGGVKTAGDALAGEWTQDMGKSRMAEASPLRIEADGNGGVRFAWDFSYTARFDGKPYDLKNSRNDSVTLQLVDPHTVDAFYRRDGQVAQKDRWVVSADRQQMTLTSTGTLEDGQRMTEKLVFQRR